MLGRFSEKTFALFIPDVHLNLWEGVKWLDDFCEEDKRRTGRDIKAEKLREPLMCLRTGLCD